MSLSPQTRSVLLSLLPGWGHVAVGREFQGLLIFTTAALAAFGLVNALFTYLGELRGVLIVLSSIALVGVAAYSVVDVVRLNTPSRRLRIARTRDRLLWEGLMAYLRSDLLTAEQKFIDCARLDRLDVEPVLRAGVAASRRGAFREARRLLRRARRLDVEKRWEWELRRELERVDRELGARRLTGGPASDEAGGARGARDEDATRGAEEAGRLRA